MRTWLALLGGLGCALACSNARQQPETPRVTVTEVAPSNAPAEVLVPKVEQRTSFAASPITELAGSFVTLVRGALDGRYPTSTPFPLAEPLAGDHLLRRRTADDGDGDGAHEPFPTSSELEFFLFAIEIGIIPKRAPSPTPTPDTQDVSALVILSRTGLKLGELEHNDLSDPLPETSAMKAIAEVGRDVHVALCEGRERQLLIGEAERPVFANDQLFDKLLHELPKPERFGEVRKSLGCGSSALAGFTVDDAHIAAHSRDGEIYAFDIPVGRSKDGPVLDGSYLVKAYKVDVASL